MYGIGGSIMINQDLIDAGYKRWEPAPYEKENCVTDLFQKCITDDVGKKYFINVKRWDFSIYSGRPEDSNRFEATVQFDRKDDITINLDILNPKSVEEVEKVYAEAWETGVYKYYEKW